jgi:hypothetical protein
MKPLLFAVAIAAALVNASAQAEYYCQLWAPPLYDGDTITASWRVVLGSVPREEIPGRGDRSWCRVSLNGGGGRRGLQGNFKSFEVLESPKYGQFHVFPTLFTYKGMRVGHDRIVVKKNWWGAMHNEPMSGTEIFDVDVVDHPL